MDKVFEIAESLGWTIERECDFTYDLGKFSPKGHDFHISVDSEGDDPALFVHNLGERCVDFDVSYEAYLHLDDEGHGKNGAPWDMREVYNDMEACKDNLLKLYYELLLVI